ncbi:ArsR/SmtB family transcription factor [Flexivirga endophytica]|nr:helix-turn-helix transcriptional regulator [Flexivirga endophytica]
MRPIDKPTAASLIKPLSHTRDFTPLASVLHVLGTPARLETVQMLMGGPATAAQLPARLDELHMLEEIGLVTSRRISRQRLEWRLNLPALERLSRSLWEAK